MKRVTYQITDHFIELKNIGDFFIEADPEADLGLFIDKKTEIINELIKQNADKLSAFGTENFDYKRKGSILQNKPFRTVINNENTYNPDLFEVSGDKKTIIGIKGLCGMIRGIIKYLDENGEEIEIDVTLEIRSRFDKPGKPWFLYTMIAESVEGADAEKDLDSAGFNPDKDDEVDITSLLTVFMFSQRLKRAYESGIYRTYVKREYNNDRLRGAIDIARHIRLNITGGTPDISYTARERCEDNKLNRLISHAWNALKQDYPAAAAFVTDGDPEFQRAISEIITYTRGSMKDVRGCIAANSQPITSPFYSDYDELRILCLRILADDSEYYIESGEDSCYSILFYIPDLWEKYLERHLRKALPDDILLKAQEEQEYYKNFEGRYAETSRPDFVFYNKNMPFFILDAKFKKNYSWVENVGDTNDFDKLIRDMYIFKVDTGAVIYPQKKQQCRNADVDIHQITEDRGFLYDFQVPIPENEDYTAWKNDMNGSIDKSVETVKESLKDILSKQKKYIRLWFHGIKGFNLRGLYRMKQKSYK